MTLDELKAHPKAYLTPDIAAQITGQHPHTIRILARENRLPYPVDVSDTRTRIPKWSFIKYWFGEEPNTERMINQ